MIVLTGFLNLKSMALFVTLHFRRCVAIQSGPKSKLLYFGCNFVNYGSILKNSTIRKITEFPERRTQYLPHTFKMLPLYLAK